MKNKGFGISEMIIFCSIFLFGIIISTVLINKNLLKREINLQNNINIANNNDSDEELLENKYIILEEKIKKATVLYINDYKEKKVISTSNLQNENYLSNLVDPYDINKLCKGYAVINNDIITPYLRCEGKYATEDYDMSLE